jgi:hypothetical protein
MQVLSCFQLSPAAIQDENRLSLKNLFVFPIFLTLATTTLAAQEQPEELNFLPWSLAELKLGVEFTAIDSKLGFQVTGGGQTKLDMEDTLGLDSKIAVFRADALIRLGARRRHRLDFSYVGYDRSAEKTLTDQIEIGGQPVIPGTLVESKLDFSLIRSTYSYAVFQDERMSVGVGLGIYVIPVSYGVNVQTTTSSTTLESHKVTLPFPAIALRGDFQLAPRLFLVPEVDAMYLEAGGIRGAMLDTRLSVEYQPWKYFGFGLGFNLMGVNLESTDQSPDYPGASSLTSVRVHTGGLMVYGKFSF